MLKSSFYQGSKPKACPLSISFNKLFLSNQFNIKPKTSHVSFYYGTKIDDRHTSLDSFEIIKKALTMTPLFQNRENSFYRFVSLSWSNKYALKNYLHLNQPRLQTFQLMCHFYGAGKTRFCMELPTQYHKYLPEQNMKSDPQLAEAFKKQKIIFVHLYDFYNFETVSSHVAKELGVPNQQDFPQTLLQLTENGTPICVTLVFDEYRPNAFRGFSNDTSIYSIWQEFAMISRYLAKHEVYLSVLFSGKDPSLNLPTGQGVNSPTSVAWIGLDPLKENHILNIIHDLKDKKEITSDLYTNEIKNYFLQSVLEETGGIPRLVNYFLSVSDSFGVCKSKKDVDKLRDKVYSIVQTHSSLDLSGNTERQDLLKVLLLFQFFQVPLQRKSSIFVNNEKILIDKILGTFPCYTVTKHDNPSQFTIEVPYMVQRNLMDSRQTDLFSVLSGTHRNLEMSSLLEVYSASILRIASRNKNLWNSAFPFVEDIVLPSRPLSVRSIPKATNKTTETELHNWEDLIVRKTLHTNDFKRLLEKPPEPGVYFPREKSSSSDVYAFFESVSATSMKCIAVCCKSGTQKLSLSTIAEEIGKVHTTVPTVLIMLGLNRNYQLQKLIGKQDWKTLTSNDSTELGITIPQHITVVLLNETGLKRYLGEQLYFKMLEFASAEVSDRYLIENSEFFTSVIA